MASLPNDIVRSILSFLPVESLLRFRDVDEFFSKTIQDPEFVNLHFQRSRNSILLHSERSKEIAIASDDLRIEKKVPFPSGSGDDDDDDGYIRFIGSCKGILCFLQNTNLMLWNPSCHKFNTVTADADVDVKYHQTLIGFTFHERFKIVMVRYQYAFPAEDEHRLLFGRSIKSLIAQIYDKNGWRVIPYTVSCYSLPYRCQIQVKSKIYWLAKKFPGSLDDSPDCVLTFDPSDESFHHIELPLSVENRQPQNGLWRMVYYELLEFEDCLCFLENGTKLWIRRENSWEELEGFDLVVPHETTCTNMRILAAASKKIQFLLDNAYHVATDFSESLYAVEWSGQPIETHTSRAHSC